MKTHRVVQKSNKIMNIRSVPFVEYEWELLETTVLDGALNGSVTIRSGSECVRLEDLLYILEWSDDTPKSVEITDSELVQRGLDELTNLVRIHLETRFSKEFPTIPTPEETKLEV